MAYLCLWLYLTQGQLLALTSPLPSVLTHLEPFPRARPGCFASCSSPYALIFSLLLGMLYQRMVISEQSLKSDPYPYQEK